MKLYQRNTWLIVVFSLYICSIVVFAGIYSYIYYHFPDSFYVASDIKNYQFERSKVKLLQNKEELKIQDKLFTSLLQALKNGGAKLIYQLHWEGNSEIYFGEYAYYFSQFATRDGVDFSTITIYNGSGIKITEYYNYGYTRYLKDTSDTQRLIESSLLLIGEERTETENALASLQTSIPHIWNFGDFLYFSTITQASVGYGDILPNSTVIRLIVASQVMIGLFLLVVLVNAVLRQDKQ
jgi:Ion channel